MAPKKKLDTIIVLPTSSYLDTIPTINIPTTNSITLMPMTRKLETIQVKKNKEKKSPETSILSNVDLAYEMNDDSIKVKRNGGRH